LRSASSPDASTSAGDALSTCKLHLQQASLRVAKRNCFPPIQVHHHARGYTTHRPPKAFISLALANRGACNCTRRAAKRHATKEFSLPHLQWARRMHRLMTARRRGFSQGPYWAPLLNTHERCEWLNVVIRKLWPVYDVPICTCVLCCLFCCRQAKSGGFATLYVRAHACTTSLADTDCQLAGAPTQGNWRRASFRSGVRTHASALVNRKLTLARTCSRLIKIVDPILRNFSPPGVMMLRAHRLKLGNRAPEIVSMRVVNVSDASVVLHAHVRFVGDDLTAVVLGRFASGRVFGGARFNEDFTIRRRHVLQ
jgi:hypothetical protein